MKTLTLRKKTPAKKIRVLIVDDHPIVRHGLKQLLNGENDMVVCGDAANIEDALAELKNNHPDVAVIDLSLDNESGLELLKTIRTLYPKLPSLVLSMHDETLYAERVLRAGAKGYVMKQEAPEKVVEAIRQVLSGQIFLNDHVSSRLINQAIQGRSPEHQSPIESLSDRELEVFRLLGRGHRTREIAEQLCVSIKTIETYREHIKLKLKIDNATELIQHAVEWTRSGEI